MAIGRSENMRRIRSKDTSPEIAVRRLLRGLGFTGYRLHRKDLPGKPDVAFIGKRKAIMIHGCFWHGHDCKEGLRLPKSNQKYWFQKIDRNRQRDAEQLTDLNNLGWHVLTIWECDLRNIQSTADKLRTFMASPSSSITNVCKK